MSLSKRFETLKFIASIKNHKLRAKILSDIGDDNLYKALHEIAINLQKGNIKLSPVQRRKLRKYNRLLKRLTFKNNNRNSRKKLIKQSEGLLPILIPTIASLIGSLIR